MTMLSITAGPYAFTARLEEERAPKTCAAFTKLLPFEQKVIQGAQLERLIASTSPAKPKPSRSAKRSGTASGQGSDTASSVGGSSPVKAAAAAATGNGGGMGSWLAVFLGIVALAAVLLGAARLARKRT